MINVGSEVLYNPNACLFVVTEVNEDGTFDIESEFEAYFSVSEKDLTLI